MKFIGKNPEYVAFFNCNKCCYDVFFKNKFITTKYSRKEIETYLN